ncbi:MAG: dehydrogenase [Deltaproteobacteria bacterium]|nr:dehydrogenase [Deltaproteobacteria bacterium]
MKTIVNISLGPGDDDYDFTTRFMDTDFHIMRFGTNDDTEVAAELLEEWGEKADAIGLGKVQFPYFIGPKRTLEKKSEKVCRLGEQMTTPVTTGHSLRTVGHEWSIRHIQYTFGNNYFNNCRALFFSGMINTPIAEALAEYTDNLKFCDPVIENGIPKLLTSLSDLKKYATGIHDVLNWVPSKSLSNYAMPLRTYNDFIIRRAIINSSIIVVPYYNFYGYLKSCGIKELSGKIVITSTAYDDRVKFLKERGVSVIIDTTPKMLEKVVGVSVLEAMIMVALGKNCETLSRDDLLEVITQLRMDPRVVYPSGEKKRVNRFAFVVHPLSRDYLKKIPPIGIASKILPGAAMDTVEKVMAYSPPFVYSKVTGIRSPTGVEAEGWLIAIGATPKQMLAHSPEFINARLLKAVSIAKNLGAQIVGLGALTKAMGDAGVTVAKNAEIPVTTGNSYSASAALWAAADAVRRMGLIKVTRGEKIKAKTMVIGATGAVGSVCSKLLATAFDELYMVDVHDAKLLTLRASILNEFKDVNVHITTRADRFLSDMDVIVTATTPAPGGKIIDIMQVKPGCIITDVNRPLNFSAKEAANRPDVLIIASGEIELPGEPEMKDIGLPPGVAYGSLAEAIVLALEGRFENFSVGRDIEWKKVSEIYKMGLKHGMKLASISGIEGILNDEDFKRVAGLARKSSKGKR